MRRITSILLGVVILAVAAAARGDEGDAAVRVKVDDFLKKLGGGEYANEKAVEAAVKALPAAGYELLHGALVDMSLDGRLREKLEAAFPAVLRGLNVRHQKTIVLRKWEADLGRKAYEQLGVKDAAWDKLVEGAFDVWAQTPEIPSSKEYLANRAQALKKAEDTGCKDPMVMFMYVAAQSYVAQDPKGMALLLEASNRLDASAYPAYWKMRTYLYAALLVESFEKDAKEKKAKLMRLFDLAMAQWAGEVATPRISDDMLYGDAMKLVGSGEAVGTSKARCFELLLGPLRAKLPKRAVTDLMEGEQLLASAEDSRGGGWASEVSDARMRMAEQSATAAEKSLERAWLENPTLSAIGVRMIKAEMLVPHGRPTMEMWYQRAMAADPDNFEGPGQKLTYLLPRWYGSYAEMIAFGRECLAEGNWDTRIPTSLLVVHQQIAQEKGMGGNYYADPAVWKDVQDVLTAAIKHDPAKSWNHQEYAYLAAISGHYDVARAEFAACGDDVNLEIFGSVQNCVALRKASGFVSKGNAGKSPAAGYIADAKADAEYETQMQDEEKTQMMAWIRDQVLPARTKNLTGFFLKLADEHTMKGEDFEALFPAEMLKSGKAAYVCGSGAKLFSFDLSAGQAKLAPGYSATRVPTTVFKPTSGAHAGSAVKLGNLTLTAKGPFGGKNPLKGKVSVETLKDLGPGNYQFRLWYTMGKNRNVMLSELKDFGTKGVKEIPFEFDLTETETQPLVVFVTVVRMRPPSGLMDISGDAMSNTSAALIDIAPRGAKP